MAQTLAAAAQATPAILIRPLLLMLAGMLAQLRAMSLDPALCLPQMFRHFRVELTYHRKSAAYLFNIVKQLDEVGCSGKLLAEVEVRLV